MADATQPAAAGGILREGEGSALLLAVPPLLVVVGAHLLFDINAFDLVDLGKALVASLTASAAGEPGLGVRLAVSEARIVWSLTVFLNFCAAMSLTVAAVMILRRSVSLRGLRFFLPVGVLLIVFGIASLIHAGLAATPMSGIFTFTFDSLVAIHGAADPFVRAVWVQVQVLNLLTVVAPVLALMAACSTLAPPKRGGLGDVAFLSGQLTYLKAILNLGSVYLVAGILHMGVWLRWPGAVVGDETLRERILDHAFGVSLYWGGTFTVMIAAFYVPALVALTNRAEAVIQDQPGATGGLTPKSFLQDHGLTLAPSKHLPQILAVLAPLLAGPIGSALSDLATTVPG